MSGLPLDKEQIFTAALEISDAAQRRAYLKAACGPNRELLAEVEELLQHDAEAGSFIERPVFVAPGTVDFRPVTEGPGTIIGPYKLQQKIGEGGFGVVYMAEQQQPVRRKVALKIIKPGMDTREVIARFEGERQALALMDHPHIARVLDAGATESSRPYFVMELVKGVPITEFCDKNNLQTEERLQLFLAVCQAVQHAHQKGIIHRDIKPSNVMVTLHDGKPVPKVIDFGVAKATSQQLTERTLFTAYGQMIGTPVYMSPEQAEMSGLDIDTRSDIYSLGVLLYELLTGTTPFDGKRLREAGYIEMQRIIREEEPPRPSTRVSTFGEALTAVSNLRSTEPGKLRQMLRGDLDLIVMKALEKERTRRYETPSSFAQDVERFLHHEAILARPPSGLYRLRKFAQRNRAAVASATAIAAALLLGTVVSTLLAIHAFDQRNQAQEHLAALGEANTKTEVARKQAVEEATRAGQAELKATLLKQLADKRAQEADSSRQAADEKRRDVERKSNEIVGLNDRLLRSTQDQRRAIYAAEMNLVRLEAQRGNLPRMRELLLQQIPGADEEDLRGWEWTYWYRFLHRAKVIHRYEGFVYGKADSALAIAPQGKLAAQTKGDKTEWIELATGKIVGNVPALIRVGVNRTPLAANGRLCDAYAVSEWAYWPGQAVSPKELTVWEPNGERITLPVPHDSIQHLSFVQLSADGLRLAAVGNDVSHDRAKPVSRLLVWDIDSRQLLLNKVEQRALNRLALSNDGSLLVAYLCHSTNRHSDGPRDVAALVDVATGAVLDTVRHNDDVDSAFLLSDCKQILLCTLGFSGNNRKELWSWTVGSGTLRKLSDEQMPDYLKGAVSPDGKLFAVSGHTVSTVRLIDAHRGTLVSTLHNEAKNIDSLTFAADGQQLVATSTAGEIVQWDLSDSGDLFALRSRPLGPMSYRGYALSPDRSQLAYVTAHGSVRLRSANGDETILSEENQQAVAKRARGSALLEYSPDGKFLAYSTTLSDDGLVQRGCDNLELFNTSTGERCWRWAPTNLAVRRVLRLCFAAEGDQVYVQTGSGTLVALPCKGDFQPKALGTPFRSPMGLWADRSQGPIAAMRVTEKSLDEVMLHFRDISSGEFLGKMSFGIQSGFRLTPASDARHLAVSRFQPDRVQVWNFAEERRVIDVPGNAVAFSSDGKFVAIGEVALLAIEGIGVGTGNSLMRIKDITVWNLTTGNLVSSISLAGNHADELRFSPDSRRLLTLHGKQATGAGGAKPEVRLWDSTSARELMAIPVAEVNHYIWDIFYDPSGTRLSIIVFAKSAGTSGGWGSTVLDATPLGEGENSQLIARRLVHDLFRQSPLTADALAALQANTKLTPIVREAALALARRHPVSGDTLAEFCISAIALSEAPREQRAIALRSAQALTDLEPEAFRSRVLLGGAQFRMGLAPEALKTLQLSSEEQGKEVPAADLLLATCRDAICALAKNEQGDRIEARTHMARANVAMRTLAARTASVKEVLLLNSLVNEASLAVPQSSGTFATSSQSLFESRDKDGDGQLSPQEAGDVVPSFRQFDEDGDGKLSRLEFLRSRTGGRWFRSGEFAVPSPKPQLDFEQQLAAHDESLKQNPHQPSVLIARAQLLAACPDDRLRNGRQSLADATKACELTKWQNPFAIDALAAAEAELGDFTAAAKHEEQAIASAPEALRDTFTARLELYRQQKPFRLPRH